MVLSLLLSGNSNACEKEDFIKYISAGKNKCIAILNLGKIKKGKKNLIVFLHGDGSPNSPRPGVPKKSHIRFAKELINNDNNIFLFARPGYFIRERGSSEEDRYSSGPRDAIDSTVVNYSWKNFQILAPALENLRKYYKPEKLILIGHSGGAYQGGTIHGKVPGLVDINILISCPCDWEIRKKLSNGKKWETKSQLKELKKNSPSFNYKDIDLDMNLRNSYAKKKLYNSSISSNSSTSSNSSNSSNSYNNTLDNENTTNNKITRKKELTKAKPDLKEI